MQYFNSAMPLHFNKDHTVSGIHHLFMLCKYPRHNISLEFYNIHKDFSWKQYGIVDLFLELHCISLRLTDIPCYNSMQQRTKIQ